MSSIMYFHSLHICTRASFFIDAFKEVKIGTGVDEGGGGGGGGEDRHLT